MSRNLLLDLSNMTEICMFRDKLKRTHANQGLIHYRSPWCVEINKTYFLHCFLFYGDVLLNVSDYTSMVLRETTELLERKIKSFFESGVTPDWAENPEDSAALSGFILNFLFVMIK